MKEDPQVTLRKVVNLVARRDFEDHNVILMCLAKMLADAEVTADVDVL